MPRMGIAERNFQVDLLRLNCSIYETGHVINPNNLSLGVTNCHTRVHNSKLNNRSSLVGIQTEDSLCLDLIKNGRKKCSEGYFSLKTLTRGPFLV